MLRSPNFRTAILVTVVMGFAINAYIAFHRHNDASYLLTVLLKTGPWAASELQNEMATFIHSLELHELEANSKEDVSLQMEILWSRLNLLRQGPETAEIRQLDGTALLLSDTLAALERFEQHLLSSNKLSPAVVVASKEEFNQIMPRVRELNILSFNGPRRISKIKDAIKQQQVFGYYLFGLLISGGLLILLIISENIRNRKQALHDELTGLPNRKQFNDFIARLERQGLKGKSHAAIYLVDLDKFKAINDSHGHHAGDIYLQTVANRLMKCASANDFIARLGGDEFVIVKQNPKGRGACESALELYCQVLMKPIDLPAAQVTPSATIGVSLYPDDGNDLSRILANADIAMYSAKANLDISYAFYSKEMDALLRRRNKLASDLIKAIHTDQLQLFFQPIVELTQQQLIGFEALLRWQHPTEGYIPPPEIIEIAEQYGSSNSLNQWVILNACQTLAEWSHYGDGSLKMNINISPSMYSNHDLPAVIADALAQTQVSAQQITIEVTEDTSMQDIESSPGIMNRLKQLGIDLALDDFGTGYSSLSLLRDMPIDTIKIDKSFVDALQNAPLDITLIRTIIQLSHSLGINVVAEGIEADQQLHILLEQECDMGQGYFFNRPLAKDKAEEILLTASAPDQRYCSQH